MKKLKGVCIGAGYFSQYHFDGWQRIPEVEISALCDARDVKAREMASRFDISNVYSDYRTMLDKEKPDFIDIITPPNTHFEIAKAAFSRKVHVICQKPLAPTFTEAKKIVELADSSKVRFMVHENFRFQPWHREIKKLIMNQAIGEEIFYMNFRTRMGDGWGEHAYLDRQPYFRDMDRFLIHETGVHFIDTFRYLGGEVKSVFASLRKLNPVIKGEDAGLILLDFESGTQAVWNANRYNESHFNNPRYTFGEFLVEGSGGSIRLYPDGNITIQPLGEIERSHPYVHVDHGFAGDSCYATQWHFINGLLGDLPFETSGQEYLKTLEVQEAVYTSAESGVRVLMND